MNANELADKLEYLWHHESTHQAAIMLRQQQAEIEALKAHIEKLQYISRDGWYYATELKNELEKVKQ